MNKVNISKMTLFNNARNNVTKYDEVWMTGYLGISPPGASTDTNISTNLGSKKLEITIIGEYTFTNEADATAFRKELTEDWFDQSIFGDGDEERDFTNIFGNTFEVRPTSLGINFSTTKPSVIAYSLSVTKTGSAD